MATKICVPVILPLEKDVIKVKVPNGATLTQGEVLNAESLVGSSESIYQGVQVAAPTTDMPVIIINQGVYELADGNRPAGYTDVGQFTYKSNDVITAIRPDQDLLFKITYDSFSGTPVKDQFLIPQNASYDMVVSASAASNAFALKIEQLTTLPVGNAFIPAVIARVYKGR